MLFRLALQPVQGVLLRHPSHKGKSVRLPAVQRLFAVPVRSALRRMQFLSERKLQPESNRVFQALSGAHLFQNEQCVSHFHVLLLRRGGVAAWPLVLCKRLQRLPGGEDRPKTEG